MKNNGLECVTPYLDKMFTWGFQEGSSTILNILNSLNKLKDLVHNKNPKVTNVNTFVHNSQISPKLE